MTPTPVLIVDDDAPSRAAYTAFLRECGYDVLEAMHGGEAVLHIHRHQPDVVLLDLVMPVLAEALLERASPTTTPILALASSTHTARRERMRRSCDDLPEKPCTPDEILARLRVLTREAQCPVLPKGPPCS